MLSKCQRCITLWLHFEWKPQGCSLRMTTLILILDKISV
uniref:Uncharacterized protein n=1 Tax=Anguilla anguilla TaxID=7936 RepID=A0A0E9RDE4_ANGAN